MSSLRNSLHRRNHKERSQLSNRARYGLLEKHGDYVLRARDYHSKQDRIQRLREKAALRNKDEFYFGMVNQRTQDGVHVQSRGNTALPVDVVKLLKTQDENYVRTQRSKELKRIDQLKRSLASSNALAPNAIDELSSEEQDLIRTSGVLPALSPGRKKKHVVFMDHDGQGGLPPRQKPGTSKQERNPALDLGWTDQPLQELANAEDSKDDAEAEVEQGGNSDAPRELKELAGRLGRAKLLGQSGRELELQRLQMQKGARRKVSGESGSGYKWRAERKR